jgi:transcriptional regulator with XRE-family HTH domain
MTGRDPENNPAAFLGAELRRGRLAARFSSQEALAGRLGFDRTVMAKAETGERPPTPEVLAAWCAACGLDQDLFARLARLARSAAGPVPSWFESWLEAEADAVSLRYWQPIIIPGLFQTAEYARALLLAAQTDTSEEAIGALVDARLARRATFEKLAPPDVTVVLDELVLHRLVGSPQVMYDQLREVAELSLRSYISVQVVPAANGANAGLGGSLNIASGDGTPDVLHMDALQGYTTEERSLVRQAEVAFGRLRGDALPRGLSRELILRLADELWKI